MHGGKSPNGLILLVKPKSPSVFHIAHYHRNRVFVIIQFCHTTLAWIVCIISSCGQCKAICCKITSILPAGISLTVCLDCLMQPYYPFIGPSYLKLHVGLLLSCPEGISLSFLPPKILILMTLTLFPYLVFGIIIA